LRGRRYASVNSLPEILAAVAVLVGKVDLFVSI
jgi:hypothetical protein